MTKYHSIRCFLIYYTAIIQNLIETLKNRKKLYYLNDPKDELKAFYLQVPTKVRPFYFLYFDQISNASLYFLNSKDEPHSLYSTIKFSLLFSSILSKIDKQLSLHISNRCVSQLNLSVKHQKRLKLIQKSRPQQKVQHYR